MYTKDELMQMEPQQLMAIADELGVKVSQNDDLEKVVYAVLDKAAEDSAASEQAGTKRKRTRIAKKDSTDKVYTVKGKDGENLDSKGKKKSKKAATPSLFNDDLQVAEEGDTVGEADGEQPAAGEEAPVRKHRGRKSKAELAALAAAEEEAEAPKKTRTRKKKSDDAADETALQAEQPDEESMDAVDGEGIVPEMMGDEAEAAADDHIDAEQLEQLQEKLTQHNADGADAYMEGGQPGDAIWEGDPGDGTDFITVVDLPIEDQGALPTLDIFDRPVAQQPELVYQPVAPAATAQRSGNFDFGELITGNGVLEMSQDGYGFLRSSDYNYLSSPDDIYVSQQQVKKYGLKTGDVVECTVRPPHDNEKYFALSTVSLINGRHPNEVRDRVSFEHLTPLFPEEKFDLTSDPNTTNPSTRIVDLFSPIGKGQRALIVAQPKTGKTILMKDIANAIAANHPEAYIMMLLIDERPEEVTDMARTVNAEVIASTFDEPADRHVKIAGIVLEKAKRMVECGHDVVIFLDSITRLARAYNTVAPASGKVLTGGVDANALQKPKRFFGAARKIEGGGSLTIIATALVDTGSKMDEVIFEEFKGTGNSEIQLSRSLSNKRVFPAIDLVQSSTRRDDLLHDETTLNRMWIIRKFIAEMNAMEAMNVVRDRLVHSRNNEEFLMSMNG